MDKYDSTHCAFTFQICLDQSKLLQLQRRSEHDQLYMSSSQVDKVDNDVNSQLGISSIYHISHKFNSKTNSVN